MSGWLRKKMGGGEPAGPPQTIKKFGETDRPITVDGVSWDQDAWRIEAGQAGSVALYEVHDLRAEACMLSYRASLKTLDAEGAYLEMWCRLPGKGEFFSKGLNQTIKGTRDWSSFEIPFMLKQGQRADLVKLNLAFTGGGTVWIRDVELLQTPQG